MLQIHNYCYNYHFAITLRDVHFSFFFDHARIDIGINTGGLLVVIGLAFVDVRNQDSQVSCQNVSLNQVLV